MENRNNISYPRQEIFLDETWIYSKGNKTMSWQDSSVKKKHQLHILFIGKNMIKVYRHTVAHPEISLGGGLFYKIFGDDAQILFVSTILITVSMRH